MCMCVCEREGGKEMERGREGGGGRMFVLNVQSMVAFVQVGQGACNRLLVIQVA